MNESCENIQNSDVSPEQKETGWGAFGIDVYIKVFIIGLLWWYLFRDSLGSIVYRWINDASWSHGFLIPLFSIYFINQSTCRVFVTAVIFYDTVGILLRCTVYTDI